MRHVCKERISLVKIAHLKTQIYNAVLSPSTGNKNNDTNLTDTNEYEGVTVLKI